MPQYIRCRSCQKIVNRHLEVCPYCGADPGGDRSDAPAAMQSTADASVAGVSSSTPPYRSLQSVAAFIQLMFGVMIIGNLVVAVMAWSYRRVLLDLVAGRTVLFEDAIRVEDSYVTASTLVAGANALLALTFVVWFWRAYSNLAALDRPRKRRAGWAIGSWFIPIGNFFIPYGIGAEIWREGRGEEATAETNLEPVISWWALFLIMGLVNQVAFFAGNDAGDDREKVAAVAGLDVVVSVVAVAAAIAAIRFVRLATLRQERLHDQSVPGWPGGGTG